MFRDRHTNKPGFISILLSNQPLNLASIELDQFLSALQQASGRAGRHRRNRLPMLDLVVRRYLEKLFGNAAPTNLQYKPTEAIPIRNANIWADTGSTIVGLGGLS